MADGTTFCLLLSVSGCYDEDHSGGVNAGGYECDIDICFAVHDVHHVAGAPHPKEKLAACQLQYEELGAEVRCQQTCTILLLLLLLQNVK